MTKFSTFGIFEEMVNDHIEDLTFNKMLVFNGVSIKKGLSNEDSNAVLEARRQALKDFFYEAGVEAFCNGEFASISETLKIYLVKERSYPQCFVPQVLGDKFIALDLVRIAFLAAFIQPTKEANIFLEDCYNSFMVDAINQNKDFYKLEAEVRSSLREYIKLNPDYAPEAIPRFNMHFLNEYNKLVAACTDPVLKQKIQAHIIFSQETSELAIYTPESRASIVPIDMPSLPSLTLLSTGPALHRSTTSPDKSAYKHNSLFASFGLRRFSFQRDDKKTGNEQTIRPKST